MGREIVQAGDEIGRQNRSPKDPRGEADAERARPEAQDVPREVQKYRERDEEEHRQGGRKRPGKASGEREEERSQNESDIYPETAPADSQGVARIVEAPPRVLVA